MSDEACHPATLSVSDVAACTHLSCAAGNANTYDLGSSSSRRVYIYMMIDANIRLNVPNATQLASISRYICAPSSSPLRAEVDRQLRRSYVRALLALMHHAGGHHQGHIWKHDHGGHRRSSSPLAGLPQCVKKEKKRKENKNNPNL
jgi:hypothetical protein